MIDYSADTRVELTWLGWLSIAQLHYEAAMEDGDKQSALCIARRAVREAKSMFPGPKRFAQKTGYPAATEEMKSDLRRSSDERRAMIRVAGIDPGKTTIGRKEQKPLAADASSTTREAQTAAHAGLPGFRLQS